MEVAGQEVDVEGLEEVMVVLAGVVEVEWRRLLMSTILPASGIWWMGKTAGSNTSPWQMCLP